MEIADYTDRLKGDFSDGNFNWYPLGDTHVGTKELAKSELLECFGIVERDPIGIWTDGGDQLSGICFEDRRWDPSLHYGEYSTVNKQRDLYLDLSSGIWEKCLWQLLGNHGETTKHVIDAVGEIAAKMKCCHAGFLMKAKFNEFFVWDVHGTGSVNSMAGTFRQRYTNDGEKIKRKMMWEQGDCLAMVMHHIHKMRVVKPDFNNYSIVSDNSDPGVLRAVYSQSFINPDGTIHPDLRWYASGGSFQKKNLLNEWRVNPETGKEYKVIINTYAEKGMFAPVELGMLKVKIRDWWIKDIKKMVAIHSSDGIKIIEKDAM